MSPYRIRGAFPKLVLVLLATQIHALVGCDVEPPITHPTFVTYESGILIAPDSKIISEGQEYDGASGYAVNGLVGITNNGKGYLYHPALGSVQLSDENSAAALEAYFAERLGIGKDSPARLIDGWYAKFSAGSLEIGTSRTLANGLRVTRVNSNQYRFENPTRRWAAVKTPQGPVYLSPNIQARLTDWFSLAVEGGIVDDSRTITVGEDDIETYGSIGGAVLIYAARLGGALQTGDIRQFVIGTARLGDLIDHGLEACQFDCPLFLRLCSAEMVDLLLSAIEVVLGFVPGGDCVNVFISPLRAAFEEFLTRGGVDEVRLLIDEAKNLIGCLSDSTIVLAILNILDLFTAGEWAVQISEAAFQSVTMPAYAAVEGITPTPICSVSPSSLDFGTVQVGSSAERTFTVTNTGGGTLSGSVSESCAHYSIVSGGGSYNLAGGNSRTVTVRFAPTSQGTKNCTIQTGSACTNVSCTGVGSDTGDYAWQPLGASPNIRGPALTIHGNSLIAGGVYISSAQSNVGVWDGTTWNLLQYIGGPVSALSVYGNSIYAAGSFSIAGNVIVGEAITRWDGNSWQSVGGGLGGGVNIFPTAHALVVYNQELIIGGEFTLAGNTSANRIARWNGSSWASLGSGMNGSVVSLTVFNNELIAGGGFTTAGGASINSIARWNGFNWQPLGSGTNNWVRALVVHDGKLIAGGDFTLAGGMPANRIAQWNGTSWQPFGSGMNSTVWALASFNGEVIAGGSFTSAGGVEVNHIASWNGTNWLPLGDGMNSAVSELVVYNGELIAGGSFTTAGGIDANYIAKWGPLP